MIRSGCVQGLYSFHLASGGFLKSFKVITLWLSLWNILQFVRVIVLHKNSKILLCISLRRNQDPDPSLHYWFLTALPTPVHLLNYLVSNCENVSFGTQVMGHGVCSLQTRNRTERLLCPGTPQGSARFHYLQICVSAQDTRLPGPQFLIFKKRILLILMQSITLNN